MGKKVYFLMENGQISDFLDNYTVKEFELPEDFNLFDAIALVEKYLNSTPFEQMQAVQKAYPDYKYKQNMNMTYYLFKENSPIRKLAEWDKSKE